VIETTARIAGPAAVALFAGLGVAMTNRSGALAGVAAGCTILTAVVLAWWRPPAWALVVGLGIVAGGLVVLGHNTSANLAWMGLCVVAAWAALTSALPVAVTVGSALTAVPVFEWFLDRSEPGWGAWFVGIAFSAVSCMFARRLRLTVEQLRAAQSELAERSRAEERSRIAAEVHDVIGHALTVSLLHISSARLALDEEPEEARRSLEDAERLARQSLEEVRATVGLMRTDGGATAPMPGADAIPALVDSFRKAGVDVTLEVSGDLARLGAARGLAAYRIVQEALTNAAKHAPGEPVTVVADEADGRVTIRVFNRGVTGRAVAAGTGVRGMQERAAAVGGEVVAGPRDGGWLVDARMAR
jgi:signal transduction histidine kinase